MQSPNKTMLRVKFYILTDVCTHVRASAFQHYPKKVVPFCLVACLLYHQ